MVEIFGVEGVRPAVPNWVHKPIYSRHLVGVRTTMCYDPDIRCERHGNRISVERTFREVACRTNSFTKGSSNAEAETANEWPDRSPSQGISLSEHYPMVRKAGRPSVIGHSISSVSWRTELQLRLLSNNTCSCNPDPTLSGDRLNSLHADDNILSAVYRIEKKIRRLYRLSTSLIVSVATS